MPAQDLIPQNDERFRDFLLNLDAKLHGKYQTVLTVPADLLASLSVDAATTDYYLQCAATLLQAEDAVGRGKTLLREGPASATAMLAVLPPGLPAAPAVVAPPGVEERVRKLIGLLKGQDACTADVEGDLGIVTPTATAHDTPPPPAVRAMSDFGVEVTTKMYGHDAQEVSVERAGDVKPALVGSFTSRVARFRLPPTTAGTTSEQLQVTVRYLDNDQPVGDDLFSPAVTVQTRMR